MGFPSLGAGESLEGFAEQYIFLDPAPRGYGVSASYYEALDSLAFFPWMCKAVYGLLSDTVPIHGFHKTGYLIISGTVGVVSFGALAGFPREQLLRRSRNPVEARHMPT